MKLTEHILRKIITEELQSSLSESRDVNYLRNAVNMLGQMATSNSEWNDERCDKIYFDLEWAGIKKLVVDELNLAAEKLRDAVDGTDFNECLRDFNDTAADVYNQIEQL